MADTALDKATADAKVELEKQAKIAAGEKEEGEVSSEEGEGENEETGDGDGEGESSESDELSETELNESKHLYKLLKNPATAKQVVAALAAQQGLFEGEKPPSKKEEAAAKREIKDIIKEALGDQYQFLSEKISNAFEAVLEQERRDQEQRFVEIQRTNVERDVIANYERLAKETKGESKRLENRMAQLSEEIPIGNMDIRTYIDRLYSIAAGERKTSPQKIADQIRRNSNDASARLPKGNAAKVEENKLPDKKMSLNESVAWASAQIQKGK